MNNQEITDYMHEWIANMKSAPSKESSILGAIIGITVMLAEIAKRLPEPRPNIAVHSPRFDLYDDAIGWLLKHSLEKDFNIYYSGEEKKWILTKKD